MIKLIFSYLHTHIQYWIFRVVHLYIYIYIYFLLQQSIFLLFYIPYWIDHQKYCINIYWFSKMFSKILIFYIIIFSLKHLSTLFFTILELVILTEIFRVNWMFKICKYWQKYSCSNIFFYWYSIFLKLNYYVISYKIVQNMKLT